MQQTVTIFTPAKAEPGEEPGPGVMTIGALQGRNSLEESDWQALHLATCYRQRFAAELHATRCHSLHERVHAPGGLLFARG